MAAGNNIVTTAPRTVGSGGDGYYTIYYREQNCFSYERRGEVWRIAGARPERGRWKEALEAFLEEASLPYGGVAIVFGPNEGGQITGRTYSVSAPVRSYQIYET